MLVTVVITTYKREPALVERALKSVICQTYSNLEIFVVDDSPADYPFRAAVCEMVSKYSGKNVKYIAHEKNSGACVARNTGLMQSSGSYIGFLDDDDEWMPEKIEEQIKAFNNEEVGLVYCSSKTVYDSKNKFEIKQIPCYYGFVYDKLILENFVGSTSFPLIKTEALKKIGGFDPLMPAAQDYDVWLRISKKYKFNFVDKPLVMYHFHDGEQITKNPQKKITALTRLFEKNKEYLESHPKALACKQLEILIPFVLAGKTKEAFQAWWCAITKYPTNFHENIKSFARIIKCILKMY